MVNGVAFSPDGTRVLTGSGDHTARLWKSDTGRLLSILQGHTSWVSSVAFSPDGTRVLTGSGDHTARLWESSTGRLLSILQGHTSWVSSVAFSPDGKLIITRDIGHALFWSVCELELVLQRDFTNAALATEQEVAYDGSNRRRSCVVAGRPSVKEEAK